MRQSKNAKSVLTLLSTCAARFQLACVGPLKKEPNAFVNLAFQKVVGTFRRPRLCMSDKGVLRSRRSIFSTTNNTITHIRMCLAGLRPRDYFWFQTMRFFRAFQGADALRVHQEQVHTFYV